MVEQPHKWSVGDWQIKVRYAKPSSGGAVGVAFVWTTSANGESGPDSAAFVIKPQKGSASTTQFAEYTLGKLASAASPNSMPIQSKDKKAAVLAMFQRMKDKEDNAKVKARWGEVWAAYANADVYLIQELQGGFTELGDVYREGSALISMLQNQQVLTSLGKLFVADAFIGNGDRLCNVNAGNILFKADGTVSAIDSMTILTSYEEIAADTSHASWGAFVQAPSASDWARNEMKRGGVQVPTKAQQDTWDETGGAALAPTASMRHIFEVDDWWENIFKSHLLKSIQKPAEGQKFKALPPTPADWNTAKAWFKEGAEQGMKEADKRFKKRSFSWLSTKRKFKGIERKSGGDANLDWTNFKMRRMYFQAMRSGKTNDKAVESVAKYAAKKFG